MTWRPIIQSSRIISEKFGNVVYSVNFESVITRNLEDISEMLCSKEIAQLNERLYSEKYFICEI